jgi:hypothetical protein
VTEEPWLRGALAGVHPLVMPVFFSFMQVREDLRRYTAGISDTQVWIATAGNSLGFQLRHIAGSVDRITTYLLGEPLDAQQLAFLREESQPTGTLAELLKLVEQSLDKSMAQLKRLDPASLYDPRTVGRRALPTTTIGLIVHLAEHTQRHLGQAIVIAKFLRQTG